MRRFSITILTMFLAIFTSISTNVYAQEILKIYDGASKGLTPSANLLGVANGKSYWKQQVPSFRAIAVIQNYLEIVVFENGIKVNSVNTALELNGKKFMDNGTILTDDKLVLYYVINENEKANAGIYIQTYDLNLKNPTTKKIAELSAGTKLTSGFFGKMSDQDMTVNYDKKTGSFLFTYYFLSDKNGGLSYSRVILTDANFNIINQYEFKPSSVDKLIKFPSVQFLDNGDAFISMQELSRSDKKSKFDRLTRSSQLYLPKDGSEYRILELVPQGSITIGTKTNSLINKDKFSTYVNASTDESHSNLYFTIYKYNAEKDELIDQKVTLPLSKLKGNGIPKNFTFENIGLKDLELSADGSVYLMLYMTKMKSSSSGTYNIIIHPIALKINESGELDWTKYFNISSIVNIAYGFNGINTFMTQNGDFGFMMNMSSEQYERAKLAETSGYSNKLSINKSMVKITKPNFRMITMDAVSGKARFSTLDIPGVKGYFVVTDNTENLGDFTYRVNAKYGKSYNKAKIVEIKM